MSRRFAGECGSGLDCLLFGVLECWTISCSPHSLLWEIMATMEPAYEFYGHGSYAYPPCTSLRPLDPLDGCSPVAPTPVSAHASFRPTRGAASGGESVVGLASMPSSSSVLSPTNSRPHASTNGSNTSSNSHHHHPHHHPSLPSLASSNPELASSFAATPVSSHSISPTTSQQTPVIPHGIIPDRRPMSRHDSGEGTAFSPSRVDWIVAHRSCPLPGSSGPDRQRSLDISSSSARHPYEGGDMDDEPLYVNARQYHRILKRRAARAREAEVRRLSTQRKVRRCP
jgi:hypothetical protein